MGAKEPPGRERLSAALAAEDLAEDLHGLSPHERVTCRTHRRWAHHCVASPLHVIAVTGHRWCRRCQTPVTVAVDELGGTVTLMCTRCHRSPDTPANRQLVRACLASLAAHRPEIRCGHESAVRQAA